MEKFGHYALKSKQAFLVFLAKLGLGRGPFKKILARLWQADGNEAIVDYPYYGLKLRLQPHNNTIERKILLSAKKREAKELAFMQEKLNNASVFIDIGANMGYYSLMAAQMGCGTILAFEPNPVVYERFQTNIALNGFQNHIRFFDHGLGSEESTGTLKLCAIDMGSSTALEDQDQDKAGLEDGQQIQFKIRPLETVLKEEKIETIDVMKIDVEGLEDKILIPFFEKVEPPLHPRYIIIEDNINNGWETNVIDYLLSHGYQRLLSTRGNEILEKVG